MLLKTPHKFICSQEIKIPEQSSKNGGGKSTENFAVTTRFNDGHIVACDSRLLTLISVFFQSLTKGCYCNSSIFKKSQYAINIISTSDDVRAALHKNGKSHCLSSTSNVSERKHFRTVETSALINQVSRGIPENYRHRGPVKRTSVIPVPHIVSAPTNVTCQFLILASNEL